MTCYVRRNGGLTWRCLWFAGRCWRLWPVARHDWFAIDGTSLDSTGGRSGEGHGLPSTGGAA